MVQRKKSQAVASDVPTPAYSNPFPKAVDLPLAVFDLQKEMQNEKEDRCSLERREVRVAIRPNQKIEHLPRVDNSPVVLARQDVPKLRGYQLLVHKALDEGPLVSSASFELPSTLQ